MTTNPLSTVIIHRTVIDQIKGVFRASPVKVKDRFFLKEAIAEMLPEIEEMLKKGYTYDDMAVVLSENSLQVKGVTLRRYCSALRKQSAIVAPAKGTRRKLQKEVSRDDNPVSEKSSKVEVQQHPEIKKERVQDATEQSDGVSKERHEDETRLVNGNDRGKNQDAVEQQSETVVGRNLDDLSSINKERHEDETRLVNGEKGEENQDVVEQQNETVVGRDLDDVPSSKQTGSHRRSSSSRSVPIGFVEMPDKL
jgi:hypothetical protein